MASMGTVNGVLADLIDEAIDPGRWQLQAACRGMPTDLFVPDGHGNRATTARAKAVCASCPVRAECLAYALAGDRLTGAAGVFGGLTAKERQKLIGRRSSARGCAHGDRDRFPSGGCRACVRERDQRAYMSDYRARRRENGGSPLRARPVSVPSDDA